MLAITTGIVVAYLADYALSRAMFALAAIPSILLTVAMWYLPDSPRWLISRSRVDQARQILLRARTNPDVNPEIADIQKGFREQGAGGLAGLFQPSLRMPLMVGVGLAVFQQITGINTVIYYAPTIFKFTGIAATGPAILAGAALTMVMWLGCLRARRCLRIKNSEGLEPSSLEWRFYWATAPFPALSNPRTKHSEHRLKSNVGRGSDGGETFAAGGADGRQPLHQHHSHSVDGCRAAGQFRSSRHADGAGARNLHALAVLFAFRPKRSDLAEP